MPERPRPRARVGGGLMRLWGGRGPAAKAWERRPAGARARMPSESRAGGSELVRPVEQSDDVAVGIELDQLNSN
ncbi:MAG: hypothetical protein ACYDHX_09030 [Methanothrix sp.]